MKYPDKCRGCNQPLYGPVKYCPFCGKEFLSAASSIAETISLQQLQPKTVTGVLPDRSAETLSQEKAPSEKVEEITRDPGHWHGSEKPVTEQSKSDEEIVEDTKTDEGKKPETEQLKKKNKFSRVVVVLVIMAIGYAAYNNFSRTSTTPNKTDSKTSNTHSIHTKKKSRNKATLPTSDSPLIRQAINDFVIGFLRDSSGDNLDELLTHYNDKVNYYAKGWVGKQFIYGDKEAYFRRWPHRAYELVSDIKISESNEDNSKVVQFTYKFHVWNENKAIKGQADNRLKLQFESDMWRIVEEKGHVKSRESS